MRAGRDPERYAGARCKRREGFATGSFTIGPSNEYNLPSGLDHVKPQRNL
jgi:hypothetical protein